MCLPAIAVEYRREEAHILEDCGEAEGCNSNNLDDLALSADPISNHARPAYKIPSRARPAARRTRSEDHPASLSLVRVGLNLGCVDNMS